MSGIVGILNLDGAPVERALIQRMTEFLAFRGPDAQEVWCDEAVGFGHATLRATVEAGRERQPCTLDGEAWITADARIDARPQLIDAIEAAGRRGVRDDATDAELILHAWRAWGDDCVARLIGDFAFAIWDAPRRRLFCARDHFGVRPFYYARLRRCAATAGGQAPAGETFIFGNTIDCLRLHPAVSGRLNELAVADFLLFGYKRQQDQTTFEDVRSLAPAHCLVCDGGEVRATRYWTLPTERVRFRSPREYAACFTELLDEAVADRLRVPRAAILMSGGLDSSSIAAAAASPARASRLAAVPSTSLHAYTIVYDHLIAHDERHWAGVVARHLGIPIEFVPVDEYGLYGVAPRTPEPVDNPFWALPVDVVRRIAAAGHRVALSGEAGDASCAPTHTLPELLATGRVVSIARDILRYRRAHGRRPPLGIGAWLRARRRHPAVAPPFPAWIDARLADRLGLRERWADVNRDEEGWGGEAYRELRSPFWPWCLLLQDAGWTRTPVEVRYPFLDVRLVSFLLGVPGVPWSFDKELLRVAARARLPREVCERPKTPLSEDPVVERVRRGGVPPVVEADGDLWRFVDRAAFLRAWGADPRADGWRRQDVTPVLSLGRWLAGVGVVPVKNVTIEVRPQAREERDN